MTEFGFIHSIRERFADLPDHHFEGIGDDCAILPISADESLLFTTDMLVEDIHFLRHATSAEELGHKSLAVNISDVAAMGARPVASLLSLSLPRDATESWAEEFMKGYHALSKRYGVALVGGDTTSAKEKITISVTAIGRVENRCIKRRRDAQAGDLLFAGAPLGASGSGLEDILAGELNTPNARTHRTPEPQIAEGVWLGQRSEVHAMMDISDGIASDVTHIMEESGVGCEISLEKIPVAEGSTLRTALCGGEEYKLLFTVSPESARALCDDYRKRFAAEIYPIGRITSGGGLRWLREGREEHLDWHGYTHY